MFQYFFNYIFYTIFENLFINLNYIIMKKLSYLFIATVLLFASCGSLTKNVTIIKQYPNNQLGEINVIGENQLTSDAVLIAQTSIADPTNGGISKKKCTYEIVLQETLNLARSAGGNIIVIKDHIFPFYKSSSGLGLTAQGTIGTVLTSTSSNCHQIKADVYYLKK